MRALAPPYPLLGTVALRVLVSMPSAWPHRLGRTGWGGQRVESTPGRYSTGPERKNPSGWPLEDGPGHSGDGWLVHLVSPSTRAGSRTACRRHMDNHSTGTGRSRSHGSARRGTHGHETRARRETHDHCENRHHHGIPRAHHHLGPARERVSLPLPRSQLLGSACGSYVTSHCSICRHFFRWPDGRIGTGPLSILAIPSYLSRPCPNLAPRAIGTVGAVLTTVKRGPPR